jgi:hypothetical protein
LIFQKVLSVEDSNFDIEKGNREDAKKTTKRIERKKSNLLLHSSGVGDELDESRSCPICLGEYQSGESICWSHNKECFHRFHAACGVAWLAKHSECPVCRAEYLVEPSEEEELKKDETAVSSVRIQNPIVIIEEEDDGEEEASSTEENSNTAETEESHRDDAGEEAI